MSSRKQNELLEVYSEYLRASVGATTATGLSPRLEGAVSHEQVTRHLAGKKKTAADVGVRVKPFVRKGQAAAGVLSIEDSSEEKPSTDEHALSGWHYDHAKDALGKGLTFLRAWYPSRDGSLPVGFQLMAKTEP